MTPGDPRVFLEAWYGAQCNGDGDTSLAFTLETLADQGWCLRVDLV
jgi:hypothetical protein